MGTCRHTEAHPATENLETYDLRQSGVFRKKNGPTDFICFLSGWGGDEHRAIARSGATFGAASFGAASFGAASFAADSFAADSFAAVSLAAASLASGMGNPPYKKKGDRGSACSPPNTISHPHCCPMGSYSVFDGHQKRGQVPCRLLPTTISHFGLDLPPRPLWKEPLSLFDLLWPFLDANT